MNGTRRNWVAGAVLAALVTALSFSTAHAATLVSKVVSWKEVGVLAPIDTTFMTDETDTTRTVGIDTGDWDWNAILAQGSVATGWPICTVNFVCTRANNGVTDTLYYNPEWGTGSAGDLRKAALGATLKPDTTYLFNGTIAAAKGSCAQSFIASPNVNVWTGVVMLDPDTQGANAASGPPSRFRLRVAGDQSGSTPKLSGLMCIITYLRKDSAR